ncbi:MAG: DEAD/DEAH box helicase [Dehalococcoidales bacterium]
MIELWEEQVAVIEKVRQAFLAGYKSILIVAPTGSGKTVIGADILRSSDEKNKASMFMAHRRELVKQSADKLERFGVAHGIIMAGFKGDMWKGVQIASIDTLRARYMNMKKKYLPALPRISILMVDEAHRSCSKTYTKLIDHYKENGAFIIGLTATPIRGDGKGLARHYDHMVLAPSMSELIKIGRLVPPRYFAPTIPDLTGVRTRMGDYVEGDLEPVMDNREAVGDIVTNWLRIAPARKTIVFATGVRHSIHIAEQFAAAGIRSAHIDGTTPLEERDETLAALSRGSIQVISNCMVLTEGFDCPSLDCCVLARPTKNLGLYLQMGGRVLRCFPGKNDSIIIDHSGNLYEHGYLEDDHGWHLTEGEACTPNLERQKEFDEKEPITCKECGCVYTGQLPCPACGYIPVKTGKYVETRHADLIEIRREKREKAEKQAVARQPATHEEKQRWYSMFLYYAASKGHKEGSVAHKYKAKFGVWPKNMKRQELQPTPECEAYIQHLNIKNSFRRRAEERQIAERLHG